MKLKKIIFIISFVLQCLKIRYGLGREKKPINIL